MKSPSRSEAIYGAGGAVLAAAVGGLIALIPYFWGPEDSDFRVEELVREATRKAEEIADPNEKLAQIRGVISLLELETPVHLLKIMNERRDLLERQIEQQLQAEIAIKRANERAKAAELAAIDARAKSLAEAEIARQEEIKRQAKAEAARIAEEKAATRAREIAEAKLAEEKAEEERRAKLVQVQRGLETDRVCFNVNCSDFILR